MAEYNTVPLGQAGTGAAYILPQGSEAADRLLQTMDYNTQVDQQNQRAKHAAALALAQSYKENAFKAKNGTLFNNELMALQQKHVQQGSDYAKQGFDIYNPNPNDPAQMQAHDQYMADRAKIYNMQDVREQLQKHLLEQDQKAAESTAGKFDPQSIQALHDFYNKNTLKGIVDKGLQAPYIRERFDPETTILNKVEPVMTAENEYVDKHGNRVTSKAFIPKATARNVENAYLSTPGAPEYVQQQIGMPISRVRTLPTSLRDIQDFNDRYYKRTPEGQQELVQAGITSYQDPRYGQLLAQKSQQDFAGKQKYGQIIDEGVQRARAKANQIYKNVPDVGLLNYWKSQQEKVQKDNPGEVVFGNQESTVPIVYQNFDAKGNPVPHKGAKGKDVVGGYAVPEQGATLFSQAFPQTKVIATPGSFIDIKNGHNVKNTKPFEVNIGSVKMEPVWAGRSDNINGTVMSKRQLQEAISKNDYSHISFSPIAYGERPVKNSQNKTEYQPVAFPYDAVRGNNKLKTTKFEQTQKEFNDLVNSAEFKQATAQQRYEFLSSYYNIK